MPAISLDRVSGGYKGRALFKDLTFVIEENEFWAILGPNGVGKSTLVRTILGLIPPVSGTVYVFGCPAKGVCPHRKKIGYVPQYEKIDPNFPARTIDVVLTGVYGQIGLVKRIKGQYKRAAIDILSRVGLEDRWNFPFGKLSVGQQRRALIARALVGDPKAIILDEPLAGLDIPSQERLMDLIIEVKRGKKIPVIFVAHSLAFAYRYVDRVVLLGPSFHAVGGKEILKDRSIVERVYGGEVDLIRPGDEHHQ